MCVLFLDREVRIKGSAYPLVIQMRAHFGFLGEWWRAALADVYVLLRWHSFHSDAYRWLDRSKTSEPLCANLWVLPRRKTHSEEPNSELIPQSFYCGRNNRRTLWPESGTGHIHRKGHMSLGCALTTWIQQQLLFSAAQHINLYTRAAPLGPKSHPTPF